MPSPVISPESFTIDGESVQIGPRLKMSFISSGGEEKVALASGLTTLDVSETPSSFDVSVSSTASSSILPGASLEAIPGQAELLFGIQDGGASRLATYEVQELKLINSDLALSRIGSV